jgi:hypothetical protein
MSANDPSTMIGTLRNLPMMPQIMPQNESDKRIAKRAEV